MKQLYSAFLVLLFFNSIQAQDDEKTKGLYYKVSLAATLTINQDYTIGDDDSGSFLIPNALFLNNSIGYQFDRRSMIGLNFEFDRYVDQQLSFFPIYFDFTYNLFDFDDLIFIRGGYGRLIDLGGSFQPGTTYKAGLGCRTFDDDYRNSFLIGLDFSRKRFGFRQTEKLTSVSIFLEFMLF